MRTEFLLTSLVVVLLPGTGVLYTLAVGLAPGLRPGIAAAFGCTLGIVPHAVASIAGLAALLHASALAFQAAKLPGVAYLLWMAWRILQEDGTLAPGEARCEASLPRIVRDGLLLNVLNPKLSLFFLAFLPQFVPADAARPALSLIILAAAFMAMTFVVFVGYGACASFARERVLSRPVVLRWPRRSFAAAFALLGARLALAER